jgi:predicted esterase
MAVLRTSFLIVIVSSVVLMGCGDSSSGNEGTPDTGSPDVSAPDTSMPDLPPGPTPGPLNGAYYVTIALTPVGGLPVPFKMALASTTSADGGTVIDTFTARATKGELVSDVLVSLTNIPVSLDGSFTADMGSLIMPGAYSPTSSDVELNAVLYGKIQEGGLFCGDVTGEVVTFSIDMAGSTFGSVPWEERGDDAPVSCEGSAVPLEPIQTCPALAAGLNTGFPSAGAERTFDLVVPASYSADTNWPLLFAYHGINSNMSAMLDWSELRAFSDTHNVIIVAPQALDLAGAVVFDSFSDPKNNRDLMLFDDMITCISQSYAIDPERIWVTGMSAGGLMTGMLIARRNDIIAAAAPFSGGMGVEYVPASRQMPVLVSWGGAFDEAFGQNFHTMATQMIQALQDNEHFVVSCDHNQGHTLIKSYWYWALQFLADHPRDLATESYTDLPEMFPEFCTIL